MASYSVTAGNVGAHSKTAVASTVDTVTFADNAHTVEIVSDGVAALYVTGDGTTPTVAGANTYVLPAGGFSTRTLNVVASNGAVVKLISSGTPTYSVTRVA